MREKTVPTAPTGWTIVAATYDPTDVSTNGISITQSTAANTSQLVTVTNSISRDQGYFKIKKAFDPKTAGFNGNFTITYNCGGSDQTVSLAAGATSAAIGPFDTGTTCTVEEKTLPTAPTGWTFGAATYDPTDVSTNGISITQSTAANTSQLVTVTNSISRDQGYFKIKKVFDPKTSGFNGNFTITYNCGGSNQTVTLAAGATFAVISPFDSNTTSTVEQKT